MDLRRLRDDPMPNVVSYTLDSEYGWATASNPSRGLLIGYLAGNSYQRVETWDLATE